ncbi:MAG: hypothetical protein KF723_23110 [Rhizobiaceae bacterium]|nr:hypothetical protein [Rhizobiaceae bacterium]
MNAHSARSAASPTGRRPSSAAPKTIGTVDPATLTAAQLSALRLFCSARMVRVPGGWRGAGTHKVSLPIARSLAQLGLVRAENSHGQSVLVATGSGRMTRDVADQRRDAARRRDTLDRLARMEDARG